MLVLPPWKPGRGIPYFFLEVVTASELPVNDLYDTQCTEHYIIHTAWNIAMGLLFVEMFFVYFAAFCLVKMIGVDDMTLDLQVDKI